MIILPLATKEEILNYKITFQGAIKREEILQADKIQLPASDISIGRIRLKKQEDAEYYDKHPEALTHFIRKAASYNDQVKVIYLTTDNYENTEFYDVYKLPLPPKKSNFLVDFLYGFLINDLRFQIPKKEKGKELSLRKLGIDDLLKNDVLEGIIQLKEESYQQQDFLFEVEHNGYEEQLQIVDFLNTLNFEKISQASISNQVIDKLKLGFEATGDRKRLKSIQKLEFLAQDNYNSCALLNNINNILYNKQLVFSEDKKILQKKNAA